MIIYSVTCIVEAAIATEWEQFFVEKHLDDLVETGYFTGYSFRKEIRADTPDKVHFTSDYFAPNLESLERYNQSAASALKQEVGELFGGKYTCSRKVYEEMAKR